MLAKSTEPSAAHQIPKQLQNLGVLLVFVGVFFLLLFFFNHFNLLPSLHSKTHK